MFISSWQLGIAVIINAAIVAFVAIVMRKHFHSLCVAVGMPSRNEDYQWLGFYPNALFRLAQIISVVFGTVFVVDQFASLHTAPILLNQIVTVFCLLGTWIAYSFWVALHIWRIDDMAREKFSQCVKDGRVEAIITRTDPHLEEVDIRIKPPGGEEVIEITIQGDETARYGMPKVGQAVNVYYVQHGLLRKLCRKWEWAGYE